MKSANDVKTPDTGFMQKVNELEKMLQLEPYTYKHSLNVASYSVRFLKSLGLCLDEETIYYSGLFHDIGKTTIDKRILHKVEPLTEKEFALIKTHVVVGFKILTDLCLKEEILFAALYHHEQYAGLGYPYGIAGTKIPFFARVASICDVFDALTMDRPYRKAYSFQCAVDIMRNSKGQFDPELLCAFLNFLDSEGIQQSIFLNSHIG